MTAASPAERRGAGTHLFHVQSQLHAVVQPGQGHDGVSLHHAAHGVLPAVGQVVGHAPALDVAVCVCGEQPGACGQETNRETKPWCGQAEPLGAWLRGDDGLPAAGDGDREWGPGSPDWSHSRQVMTSACPELTE